MIENRYWHELDESFSPLGFGAWQIAGNYEKSGRPAGWGKIDEKNVIGLIHEFLDSGLRLIDTAQSYGNGRSESLIGKALSTSSLQHRCILCTKFSLEGRQLNKYNFETKLNSSLTRLKRDYIDILLLHSPPDDIDWSKFNFDPILKAIKSGKIRTFGISARGLQGALNFLHSSVGSCVEWSMNLTERRPPEALFPLLEAKKFNFIARSPLARGILTRKRALKPLLDFKRTDFRSTLSPDWIQWAHGLSQTFHARLQKKENLEDVALLYLLAYKSVSAIIPGIRSMDQLLQLKRLKEHLPLRRSEISDLVSDTDSFFPKWD